MMSWTHTQLQNLREWAEAGRIAFPEALTPAELREAIERSPLGSPQRMDLIKEAVRRIHTYPRAWLPEDSRGLHA